MKDAITNDFSWIDIIEPVEKTASLSVWYFVLIFILAIVIIYLLNKYFNIKTKVSLLFILLRLKQYGDVRSCSRRALNLLSRRLNLKSNRINSNNYNSLFICRSVLIDFSYSKKRADSNDVKEQLIKLIKLI